MPTTPYSHIKVYLAGPIFYYGDYLRSIEWANRIRATFPGIDIYSPVENTEINGVEGKKKFAGSKEIAQADNKRLDNTEILIACIDGDVIPAGTACECGRRSKAIEDGQKGIIIGVGTDNRDAFLTHSAAKDIGGASAPGETQYCYKNLYVTGVIKSVGVLVTNFDEVIAAMKKYIKETYGYEANEENEAHPHH